MPTTVRVTREVVKEETYQGWDYACGAAVREALEGHRIAVAHDFGDRVGQ